MEKDTQEIYFLKTLHSENPKIRL